MKYFLLGLISLLSFDIQALEYEIQLENESVSVARAKIMPNEEIGLHRDAYPQVVFALQGGIITRLEADGSTTDVNFPTGRAIFREIDPGVSGISLSNPIKMIPFFFQKVYVLRSAFRKCLCYPAVYCSLSNPFKGFGY